MKDFLIIAVCILVVVVVGGGGGGGGVGEDVNVLLIGFEKQWAVLENDKIEVAEKICW